MQLSIAGERLRDLPKIILFCILNFSVILHTLFMHVWVCIDIHRLVH